MEFLNNDYQKVKYYLQSLIERMGDMELAIDVMLDHKLGK